MILESRVILSRLARRRSARFLYLLTQPLSFTVFFVSLIPLPALGAEPVAISSASWILGCIAASLIALLGMSIWFFRRMVSLGDDARLRGEALDALPQAIMIANAAGDPLQVNSAWRDRVPGGTGDGVTALESAIAGDEDARKAFSRLRATAMAGGVGDAELAVRQMNGQGWWCRASVRPMPHTPGAVQWSLEDCPVRNALDQAMAEEQERLVGFLDDFPIGYFSVDQDGRFKQVNATFAEWLATTTDELLAGELRLHDVLADDDAGARKPWRAISGDEENACGEVAFKGRDGREFRALLAQTTVADANGLRTRTLVRDLSGERGFNEALSRVQERFHRFFDDAPVGIAILDNDGTVTECSTSFGRMASRDAGAIQGQHFWNYVADDERDRVRQWVLGAAKGGETSSMQVVLASPDSVGAEDAGPGVSVSLFARRYEPDDEGPGVVVVHALDQTEQRNLENQFFQSQKMELVGQLAGGVAHDFNNLLTAMIGFCDLLLQRHSPKDQSFADIMQIKQNANRAANLVRQLLAFSRQQTLQPKVLNITDVLAELSHLLRRLIGADVELNMTHGRDLWLVKVDQSQLEQVIINLAVNARDAVEGGGTLTIRTSNLSADDISGGKHPSLPPANYVVLEVSDSGSGIPKDILDKIFEPFFTTKEVGSGTGLGLSTVYGIITQTGGHIFVDSEPGKGACFTIYLPQNESMPDAAEEEESKDVPQLEAAASDLTGFGTVMLVEDEDAVRMFGARALRNKGYTVVEAASGEEALEILTAGEEEIDLLVTDVVMPGLDGPSMIRKVRETHPDLRVVFISGYTEDSFRQRLDQDAGEIHFLPKPFTLQQLAGVVKEVMADAAA